jgi:hypothetical protein
MKQKFFALCLFGQLFTTIQAQTMNLIPISGLSTAYAVANIKKITFSDGNLVVTNTGATGTFALAGNRSILFSSTPLSTATNALVKNSFYLYLNPIMAVLTISNVDASAIMTDYDIISLDGRILKTKHNINRNEAQIGVSDVPSGVYFCRITTDHSTQTLKFLKQ